MKVSILIILLAFLVSCGNSGRKPSTESQLGNTLVSGGQYGAAEKNTAVNICYAFRSKNTNYRASFLGTPFNFNATYSDCEGDNESEVINTTLKAPLSSQPMVFDAVSDIPFLTEVQTDKNGVLKEICASLLSGGDPSKSVISGGSLVEVSFLSSSAVEFIIVRSATSNGSGYIIDKEERFHVDISPGTKTGQVKYASKEATCSNGRVERVTQQALEI